MKLHLRGGTAHRGWCTAPWSPQPTCTTSTRCPIAARRRAARLWRQRLRQPEAADRVRAPQAKDFTSQRSRRAATSTRPCARRTAPSPRCAPASSTCSAWSSGCGVQQSALPRPGQRTPRARLWRWLWPTSSSREEHYMDRCVHGARQTGQMARGEAEKASAKWRNARQNRTAAPKFHRIGRPARGRYWMALGGYLFSVALSQPPAA